MSCQNLFFSLAANTTDRGFWGALLHSLEALQNYPSTWDFHNDFTFLIATANQHDHRISGLFEAEGILKIHLIQLLWNEHPHLYLDSQSTIQPDLECHQGWSIYHLSGQPVPMSHHHYCKKTVIELSLDLCHDWRTAWKKKKKRKKSVNSLGATPDWPCEWWSRGLEQGKVEKGEGQGDSRWIQKQSSGNDLGGTLIY